MNFGDMQKISNGSLKQRKFFDTVSKRPGSVVRSPSSHFLAHTFESVVFSRDHRATPLAPSVTGGRRTATHRSLDVARRPQQKLSKAVPVRCFRWWIRVRSTWRSFGSFLPKLPLNFSRVHMAPVKAMRLSLVTAVVFGMVSVPVVRHLFGKYALAQEQQSIQEQRSTVVAVVPEVPTVLGAQDELNNSDRFIEEVVADFELTEEDMEREKFEEKIREMVEGFPIADMAPFIAEKDRTVAIFLIAIAKKESAWGKRVPVLNAHDCFNYWGYRGQRRFMGTGGHTCFNSPKDAVDTVAKRIETLVYTNKVDTPAKMMSVWKCGHDCSGHSKESTRKWIQDVEMYFHKLDEES